MSPLQMFFALLGLGLAAVLLAAFLTAARPVAQQARVRAWKI